MIGKLFVIEGADASGKHTQAQLLVENLKKQGLDVVSISFPRYETFFGKLVTKYLKGEFGSLKEVKPELAALLYSLDRYDALSWLEEQLAQEKTVVCDRYFASNIAHQGAKFEGKEQQEFLKWVEVVESRLPKPTLTIFLDLPVSVSSKLMHSRSREKDIHELDLDYLEATRQVYLLLSEKDNWFRVKCQDGEGIKSRDEISKIILQKISEFL